MNMKASTLSYFILHYTLLCNVNAFTTPTTIHPAFRVTPHLNKMKSNIQQKSSTRIYISIDEEEKQDSEIERLKSMAAKLRAEAASLEADRAETLAFAAQRAFEKFDINKDGQISLSELKTGLEKEFKTELSQQRVEALMKAFDDSGDGALQLEEFVTIDQFRNKLDALVREEKALAAQAKKEAVEEEMLSKAAEAVLEQINDRPPTGTDKVLSILPYLFPLLDGFQFARFLLMDENAANNPFVAALALLYIFYRSIPFGGFVAFFALSTLSGNYGINRLIRYNMQQAIYLDIALFFPGLIGALGSITGASIPKAITETGTDGIFIVLLITLGYCTVSSLLGVIPDKIPLISEAVNQRTPAADSIDISMFKVEDMNKMRDEMNKKKDDDEKKKD